MAALAHPTRAGATAEPINSAPVMQRDATGAGPEVAPPIVNDVLGSPGRPLDAEAQASMGQAFGRDFSGLRVHTDTQAAESARAVHARAYTVGRHVVFDSGQYRPGTLSGHRLLAHELVHVAQQGAGGGGRRPTAISAPHGADERQADAVADRVLGGHTGDVSASSGPGEYPGAIIQRTPAPPTYGGATGTVDPSRVRIDFVPDFVADSMTAPRTVGVRITDPTVVHLTWMLYDPADQMMHGSYSTIPGAGDATTRPFELQPSHFSGAGFASGSYLLRCVGLNAQHQPVVYADREFHVRRSTEDIDVGSGRMPVRTFFFPGTTGRRAMIVGGVHGTEQAGVQVVELLLAMMQAPDPSTGRPRKPAFTVIVVPELFPENVAAKRRSTPRQRDPNRQMPRESEPVGARQDASGRPLSEQNLPIEPENLVLLSLADRFRPERIAMVHGVRSGRMAGISTDPRPGADERADDELASAMAEAAATEPRVRIPGNVGARGAAPRYGVGSTGKPTRYPTSTQPHEPGVTAGQYLSRAAGNRPAMNVILIEPFQNYRIEDRSGPARDRRRVELTALATVLREIFLERR